MLKRQAMIGLVRLLLGTGKSLSNMRISWLLRFTQMNQWKVPQEGLNLEQSPEQTFNWWVAGTSRHQFDESLISFASTHQWNVTTQKIDRENYDKNNPHQITLIDIKLQQEDHYLY